MVKVRMDLCFFNCGLVGLPWKPHFFTDQSELQTKIARFADRGRVSFHEADESGDNQDVEEVTEGDDEAG